MCVSTTLLWTPYAMSWKSGTHKNEHEQTLELYRGKDLRLTGQEQMNYLLADDKENYETRDYLPEDLRLQTTFANPALVDGV